MPGRATGDAASFELLARRFLGPEVLRVEHADSVAARYPTGVLARITPEMIAAARASAGLPATDAALGNGAR